VTTLDHSCGAEVVSIPYENRVSGHWSRGNHDAGGVGDDGAETATCEREDEAARWTWRSGWGALPACLPVRHIPGHKKARLRLGHRLSGVQEDMDPQPCGLKVRENACIKTMQCG
jgi:hypothetical protein